MRIDFQYTPQPPEADRAPGQNSGTNRISVPESPSPLGEDHAQLSGAHAQVEALAAQASQLPEVRQERVQSLRQLVEKGQYPLDPQNTAAAMLANMISSPAA